MAPSNNKHVLNRDTLSRKSLGSMRESLRHLDMNFRDDHEIDALYKEFLAQHPESEPLHVFAYGSLLWNPVVEYRLMMQACLQGFHRQFCFKIVAFRASEEAPGLMLGLDEGGSCVGAVLAIAPEKIADEMPLIWWREMISNSYLPKWVDVETPEGEVRAITFIANPDSERYAKNLPMQQQAKMIAQAEGHVGTNRDYLFQTHAHLLEMGIQDAYLNELDTLVRQQLEQE